MDDRWQFAPKDPTQIMVHAGARYAVGKPAQVDFGAVEAIYKAMLAVAPPGPSAEEVGASAIQRLWCEAIIATQDGTSGRMICDVEALLHYVNTRKDALDLSTVGGKGK